MTENYQAYGIIDAHCHIFPEKISAKATKSIGKFYGIAMSKTGSPAALLQSGSRAGIARYLVCSTATTPAQVRSINDYIAGECAKHPAFFGFGSLHPDLADIPEETAYIRSLGLHGIKLHPDFQKFDIDCPGAYRIYGAAGDLPILIHMGDARYTYSAPERLAHVLRDFPKLHVIAAHLGGYSRWTDAIGCLPRAGEFLRFDVSSSLAMIEPAFARRLIDAYGYENCFWGSDFPMWDHLEELGRFSALGLPEEQNRAILSENFKAYFGI